MNAESHISKDDLLEILTMLSGLKESHEEVLSKSQNVLYTINTNPWIYYNRLSQFLNQEIEICEKSIFQIKEMLNSVSALLEEDHTDYDAKLVDDLDNTVDSITSEFQRNQTNMNWMDFFVLNILLTLRYFKIL